MKKNKLTGILSILACFLFMSLGILGAERVGAAACAYTTCNGANTSFPCDCGENAVTANDGPKVPYCCAAKNSASSSKSACETKCSSSDGSGSCNFETYSGTCTVGGVGDLVLYNTTGNNTYDRYVSFTFKAADGTTPNYMNLGVFTKSTGKLQSFTTGMAWSSTLGVNSCTANRYDVAKSKTAACKSELMSGTWNCTVKLAQAIDCLSDDCKKAYRNVFSLLKSTYCSSSEDLVTVKFTSLASIDSTCGMDTSTVGSPYAFPGASFSKESYTEECSSLGGTATCTETSAVIGKSCSGVNCPTSYYKCSCDCSSVTTDTDDTTTTTTADASVPSISSIVVANGGDAGYIDTNDTIKVTFNKAIDPASINGNLDEGGTVTGIAYSKTGGVSVSSSGVVTIKNIAAFDAGSVDDSGTFTVKLALSSSGKILTITLTSGDGIGIASESFGSATQTGGTVEDADGNGMEGDSINVPTGSFSDQDLSAMYDKIAEIKAKIAALLSSFGIVF